MMEYGLGDEILIENDAAIISKIPISRKSKLDRMIWRDSITREFTVKSAYYVAHIVLGKEKVCRDLMKKVWRKIWTVKVAPKIKYFHVETSAKTYSN